MTSQELRWHCGSQRLHRGGKEGWSVGTGSGQRDAKGPGGPSHTELTTDNADILCISKLLAERSLNAFTAQKQ